WCPGARRSTCQYRSLLRRATQPMHRWASSRLRWQMTTMYPRSCGSRLS
ncbi:uncharacterized protein METZ01_LOCUS240390, partial [marine metagenome]